MMNDTVMDRFYDVEIAKSLLRAYIVQANQEVAQCPTIDNLEVDKATIAKFRYPRTWRMLSGSDEEEVNVRVVGIICRKDLPPFRSFTEHLKLSEKHRLRQHVKLTGLGLDEFHEGFARVGEVAKVFDARMRRMESGNRYDVLQDMETATWEGNPVLDLHNRYFSYRTQVPDEKDLPFSQDVDPNHALEDAKGNELVHVGDNVVVYLKKRTTTEGEIKYTKTTPDNFHIGDIVEATMSFVAFPHGPPGKIGSHRLKLVLRALALVNTEEADKRRHENKMAARLHHAPRVSLKRKKICYDSSDEEGRDSKTMRMDASF
ncbi:hypothetical protein CVT24_007357 [Panaeolus cyanescens]|uniref:Uncharacterized protein n=1 Tax=Panaeolus cyanescens TaxID=181874 RepID=A0A409YW80_9AGAR|nr:hypothetical protein CVT24_007357 [Panaeolus cyanescens]